MASTKKFGPDVKTVVVGPPAHHEHGHVDTKATITMSALSQRQPARAKSEADRTVMLQLNDMVPMSPMEEVAEPPQVKLNKHTLPTDGSLDPRLVLITSPDSERAASFRILRHHVMEHGRPQVLVVSSARPGEGKTTCAANLALALAECGRARVLLAEATLRQPQLARMFQFTPAWCFADQLAAHREQPLLDWNVTHVADHSLHVAAMDPGTRQSQLLDAPAFSIAMERLRMAAYDHIVIDAPAVLGSAEVNLIQDAADGVILTARAGQTTARDLRTAVEQLSPTKVTGIVLLE